MPKALFYYILPMGKLVAVQCLQLYLLEYTNAFGFCWGWDWSYGNEGHGFIDDYLNCFLNDHDPFQGTKTMA